MKNASGTLNAAGRVMAWILAVLLALGLAGLLAWAVLRSQGVTYFVEFGEQRYLANGDGGRLALMSGESHDFAVKALTGGEVNFEVKITSNPANNFTFSHDGEVYQFVSGEDGDNDYSQVFGLEKETDGFTLTLPEGFTVQRALEEKFGGAVELGTELQDDKAYFMITVTAGESSVQLWFLFGAKVSGVTVDPSSLIF